MERGSPKESAAAIEERTPSGNPAPPGPYDNAAVLRLNAMRHLPNVFVKGQLCKILFLFPDPHFKVANHRRRIISMQLLDSYAYFLRRKGRLYCATDVRELHEWMCDCLSRHPSFRQLSMAELGWPEGHLEIGDDSAR